jgi:hypothetical protein
VQLTMDEKKLVSLWEGENLTNLEERGITLHVNDNFPMYRAIRRAAGDSHLNQAFDTRHIKVGAGDFWLLAANKKGEAIATYCLRRFVVDDFYDLIRSLRLWFSLRPRRADRRFVVECQIPAFGGEVVHGGGLWIRDDYRGFARLAEVMPRYARAVALGDRPFDHDSGMICNNPADPADVADRKASYMGRKVYGFARVHRFVDGWFPPEERDAIMHLCHATRAEAIASLCDGSTLKGNLRLNEFGKRSLVDQHDQPVYTTPVLRKGQDQASI